MYTVIRAISTTINAAINTQHAASAARRDCSHGSRHYAGYSGGDCNYSNNYYGDQVCVRQD